MMISQDDIIGKLNSEQKLQLITSLNLQIKDIREKYIEFYSESAPLFVKFKVFKEKYIDFNNFCSQNPNLKKFKETGSWGIITKKDKEDLLLQIDDIYE